jgi:hypothetical protein
MTILRDADIWAELETHEKPTHDEEGRKTHTQAAVRTLHKAVQDAESGGGAFCQTLFIRCFTCSSGYQTLTA